MSMYSDPNQQALVQSPLSLAALAERLERLERANERLLRQRRLLSWVVLAGVVFAVLGLVMPQAPAWADKGGDKGARVLRGRQFVLVDGRGTQRAVLGVDDKWPALPGDKDRKKKEGVQPGLYLRDKKGKPRLALVAGDDDASLYMLDAEGKPALVVATAKDRQSLIAFNDPKGVTRGLFGLGKENKALLILRGNGALFGINDLAGKTRALVGTDKDGDGVVVIQDKAGKAIAQLP
jgi:hypothetical protein